MASAVNTINPSDVTVFEVPFSEVLAGDVIGGQPALLAAGFTQNFQRQSFIQYDRAFPTNRQILTAIQQGFAAMSGTIESQVQGVTNELGTFATQLEADLKAIQASIPTPTPGSVVTQADADALSAASASLGAVVTNLNTLAQSLTPPPAPAPTPTP